jgi:hypothetical protein
MATKSKGGVSGAKLFKRKPPKRVRQGQGQHSKPNHGRKQWRGQGRG